MTLPCERYRSVKWAREFLRDLLDRSKTKRIPLEIRRKARCVLKHYPSEFEMERVAKKCPEVFERDEE